MEKRQLGTTDLMVSKITLGSMTWGEQNSEAEAFAQIDAALAAGINMIDTAEMYSVPPRAETYGHTETIIGNWFARTGRRDDVILATKVASRSPRFPYIRPHLHDLPKLDRRSVREACEASLKRLKTDYIDLYQIHWPERPVNNFQALRYKHVGDDQSTPFLETLETLGELQREGKIRHYGLSNDTPWGILHGLELAKEKGLPRPQSIQNPYSLLNRSFEVGLAEISIRERVGLLAYSVLGFGVLSGKYLDGARPVGARLTLFGDTMTRYLKPKAIEATQRYVALARDFDLDPAMAALAFAYDQPFVTSTIIGATTIEQLECAISSASLTLPQALLDAYDAVDDELTFPAP